MEEEVGSSLAGSEAGIDWWLSEVEYKSELVFPEVEVDE